MKVSAAKVIIARGNESLAAALNDNPGITIDYDWSCPLMRVSVTRAFTVVAGS